MKINCNCNSKACAYFLYHMFWFCVDHKLASLGLRALVLSSHYKLFLVETKKFSFFWFGRILTAGLHSRLYWYSKEICHFLNRSFWCFHRFEVKLIKHYSSNVLNVCIIAGEASGGHGHQATDLEVSTRPPGHRPLVWTSGRLATGHPSLAWTPGQRPLVRTPGPLATGHRWKFLPVHLTLLILGSFILCDSWRHLDAIVGYI